MSRATQLFTTSELVDLLRQSQAVNSQAGITGLLVYHEGRFMQVLEGDEEAITATYARILCDPRHNSIFKLADKSITQRSFAAWSMAFQEVEPVRWAQLEQVVGYLSPEQLESVSSNNAADEVLLQQLRHLILLPSH